jgi:pyruvate formate lyase activating enzyme
LESKAVQCQLCEHRCIIKDGSKGICQVRENVNGELITLVYGNLIAEHADPIEKKPLYHFLPGSKAYSVATPGCNFRCNWCQNWQISQMPKEMNMPSVVRIKPETIVKRALSSGCKSIAYTYTEPTIFFEYTFDVAKLAKEVGFFNIYVTNGFMTPEMLDLFYPYLDAANVDIKAFKDETYRRLMGGRLEPVLGSCKKMKSMGIWLEVTTLIVPGVNDDPKELKALAEFIVKELGPNTPWHLSRFYPQYKMTDREATNSSILYETKAIGEALGLKYVYIGNVYGPSNTLCSKCGHVLISRSGYTAKVSGLNPEGCCEICGTHLEGKFFDA